MPTPRILIVEDDLISARIIREQLCTLGYRTVGLTPRGEDGLRLSVDLKPDLVLMDITLDGSVDGIEAARSIRDAMNIPVVFLTSNTSDALLERAKGARPYGFLVKPATAREIHTAIEVALNLHNSEVRLRCSEARGRMLSRAVEQSPASIVITDRTGTIEYVNPHFSRVTGYSPSEVLGQNPRILKSGVQSDAFYRQLWETISAGGEWCAEFHNRRKDGSLFWEQACISGVRDENGAITHFVAVKEDITARKESEEHLLKTKAELQETNARLEVSIAQARDLAQATDRANQAKSAFLAAMSHELRTPLNVINGLSATLLEQAPGDSQRTALEMIHRSGENLLGIIEEILDFTRLQAGRATIDEQLCDLSPVVFHALRVAVERASGKPVDVRCRIDPDVPARLVADGRRIGQVLTNLLCNAVKFTEFGHVELHIQAALTPERRWTLAFNIRDTGIGIEPATGERLFQPFTQADPSITRRYGGSGLGLAISRTLAQLMSGDITVASTAGEGSTFRFTLLAGHAGDASTLIAAERVPQLEGRRALIAVAHPSHASYVEILLRNLGMECAVLDQGTLLPGIHGPGCAFDLLVVESAALPPGLRSRWDRLHVGSESAPVIWLSSDPAPEPGSGDRRTRHLAWPVPPEELRRAACELVGAAQVSSDDLRQHPGPVPLGKRLPLRILAADDVRTNRDVLRIMLKHLAYEADFVENGEDALDALARRTYDLVLLDLQMPVMDGLTAAREICRRFAGSRPRLVAITAHALPGARAECLAAGMDDYLAKPVVPRQLDACFRRLFQTATSAEANDSADDGPAATVSTSMIPWVDRAHLSIITDGHSAAEARDLVGALMDSFRNDFHALLPRLRQACRDRDAQAATQVVHALKGGALTLGWRHFAESCIQTLATLREGTFSAWDTLAEDLAHLHTHSECAMEEFLETGCAEPTEPGICAAG